MANQNPLNETTLAAGGYLVPQVLQDALISKVNRMAAALSLSSVQRINSNRASWPVYLGRPTAAFVSEGNPKPQTGAEFTELLVNIKKMATIVVYTEELLEDARLNPEVLINDDVERAFADLIDANILGTHPGGASNQATFSTNFDAALLNTTQFVEYAGAAAGTSANDEFALALSGAMEQVEANGYEPNGIIVAFDGKRALRDARDTTKRPIYSEGFVKDVDNLMGMNLAFSTNLDGFPIGRMSTDPAAPAKVLAIVGDFRNNSKAVMRTDLSVKRSSEATLSSPTVNLFETNKVAVRWEMRMGFQAFDVNRAFCKITNLTQP